MKTKIRCEEKAEKKPEQGWTELGTCDENEYEMWGRTPNEPMRRGYCGPGADLKGRKAALRKRV
jgi:hypothetical protein